MIQPEKGSITFNETLLLGFTVHLGWTLGQLEVGNGMRPGRWRSPRCLSKRPGVRLGTAEEAGGKILAAAIRKLGELNQGTFNL